MHNPSPTQAWACLCVSLSICAFPINAQVAQRVQGRILDRGEDFTVFENTRVAPDGNRQTNQFTLLENALNYQENGEWKISEDLIESFPGGAIARRGPHRAIFSEDLNTQFAFDIETSAGQRIRGGLRSIQATDFRTGETVTFGTLKESVKAELLPPNKLIYRSAFEGIDADLLIVWKHNMFSHDLILREQPQLPEN